MIEIAKITLENEMDLILAHKQSMRLAELTGLTLSAQTTFATAVSEVSRSAISNDNTAHVILYVAKTSENINYVVAILEDRRKKIAKTRDDGFNYAKKLVSNISSTTEGGINRTELRFRLPTSSRIDNSFVEKWRIHLNTDPSISPYEEIKRKNKQLLELSEKLKESEMQYKSLTDSLPIMIFSVTTEGEVTFGNQWLSDYTGSDLQQINSGQWADTMHHHDIASIWPALQQNSEDATAVVTFDCRFREARSGEYRWHTGVFIAMADDDGYIKHWNAYMVDVHAQKMIEAALKDNKLLKAMQGELEEKVNQLNKSNHQLQQFAYIASHDLQEPLRKISFFSDYLKTKFSKTMPKEAHSHFDSLIDATSRMRLLVQDILAYSTIGRDIVETVDLNKVAQETLIDLEISISEKNAEIIIEKLLIMKGNARQLKQLFENLLSNALKFSSPGIRPLVTVTARQNNNNLLLSFKDNGIGFEDQYVDRMFDMFQRLHTRDKYSGTGIGLAICKKIVDMHNGTITAYGEPGKGATFMVSFPLTGNAGAPVHVEK